MAITLDQFIYAIAGQESAGTADQYRAENPRTGALGKYQIMPYNIVPWSKQYLGYAVTPAQFKASGELQERLARAVLSAYFNQYGARGAAAKWYSGSHTSHSNYTRFRSDEPSIGEYVDQVLARAGRSPGGARTYAYESDAEPNIPAQPTDPQPEGPRVPESAMDGYFPGLEAPDTGLEAASSMPGLDAPLGSGLGSADAPGKVGEQPQQGQSPAELLEQAQATLKAANVPDGMRNAVIAEAKKYLGTAYVYGGSTPAGFDCSGLLQYAFSKVGLTLPRVSYDQLRSGKPTLIQELLPGDFVGFGDGGHIALYLGNNQILEAPRTGQTVRVRELGSGENAFGVSIENLYK